VIAVLVVLGVLPVEERCAAGFSGKFDTSDVDGSTRWGKRDLLLLALMHAAPFANAPSHNDGIGSDDFHAYGGQMWVNCRCTEERRASW
jgi:hypothetical protein